VGLKFYFWQNGVKKPSAGRILITWWKVEIRIKLNFRPRKKECKKVALQLFPKILHDWNQEKFPIVEITSLEANSKGSDILEVNAAL
jgi:hypothetical protein